MNFLKRTHLASLMRHCHLKLQLARSWSEKDIVPRKVRREFTFRLAEPRDFNAVVKLSEGVFKGFDYIPVVFHDWLKMDNLSVMLAHRDEKLVGLGACFIVDDGRTFVLRGGRIISELRGHGLNRELIQTLEKYVRGNFPKVTRQRLISEHFSSAKKWRRVLEHDLLYYDVEEKHSRVQIPPTGNELEMETCTKEYFSEIILSSPVTKKLFPNDVLVFDYIPYEPLRSNIDYIVKEHDLYFFVEKCSVGADPVSFSHGIHAQRVQGVEWLATVYTDNPDLFEAHLLRQFKLACELIKGKFTISVSLQDNRKAACVPRRLLGDVLRLKESKLYHAMALYERDFN